MSGDMNVKKNRFVEEWNGAHNKLAILVSLFSFLYFPGRREITEKTFEFDRKSTPYLLAWYGLSIIVFYKTLALTCRALRL